MKCLSVILHFILMNLWQPAERFALIPYTFAIKSYSVAEAEFSPS